MPKGNEPRATGTGSGDELAGGFVHLHLHTEYSLLDGANRIDALLDRVKELGMDAVAVTDHGNLHAAAEFHGKATAAGIRPILGIEAYVAPGDRTDRTSSKGPRDTAFHLVLLAENEAGWRNLVRLSSDAYLEGFFYRPRMDRTTLARWSDGLIAINGHLGSSIAHHLLAFDGTGQDVHWDAAVEEARWHAATFAPGPGDEPRFYLELQRHGIEEEDRINPLIVRLARELDLPLVCDNDAHFLRADDHDLHDTLCCISMNRTKDDESRLRYSPELYVKSARQMVELFEDLPEAVENTVRIASRCRVAIDFDTSHVPIVRVEGPADPAVYEGGDPTAWFTEYGARFVLHPVENPADRDDRGLTEECDRALRLLCEAGLVWRYGPDGITEGLRSRCDRELAILADKGISAYFLIVWDFVSWARRHGIPANARGSGVGTMVGYLLGLSNACPERYGLLFERFTDPDRSEYPDIDIDICQGGRGRVIDYVRAKYEHVAQIITFGRLKARAAIKDVARVHGLSAGEGQRLANLVPAELHVSIEAALEKDPEFRAEHDRNPTSACVIDTARRLEHHARHAGVHAAGVVIATEPLEHLVPLCRATGTEDVVTQWDGPTCERIGLLKMDLLGLRTLSTIEHARTLIRDGLPDEAIWRAMGRTPGDGAHPLDLDRLPCDDQRVLDLFRRGDTAGIFQFESGGMRRLLLDMKPDRLEDLIAANALFRPGPMDLIPEYCNRKRGRQSVPRVHPVVDEFTAETYGVMVYQEQVMQIVHGLGDIPLREAYGLIKAISKKRHATIKAIRPRFVEGALAKGLDEAQADELFGLILRFAGYGFNKSHATGYALIAYQTAWLKTWFPAQYMASVLTYESAARKTEDWAPYLEACRKVAWPDHTARSSHAGVAVRPPDINLSEATFSVVFDEEEPRDNLHGHIRFGLGGIKGAGPTAIEAVIAERRENGPFTSIYDFCSRESSRSINRAGIEALIKGGSFDSLHGASSRASLCAVLKNAIASGQADAVDRRAGQMSIFGELHDEPEQALPRTEPWTVLETLQHEKACLGIHVSGHPLDEHADTIRDFCSCDVAGACGKPDRSPVVVGGTLSSVRETMARTGRSAGQRMAILTLQDRAESIGCVVFSDAYRACAASIRQDHAVVIVGRTDHSREETQIIANEVIPIEEACTRLTGSVVLTFSETGENGSVADHLETVADLLRGVALPGDTGVDVLLRIHTPDRIFTLKARDRIAADTVIIERLKHALGSDRVHVTRRR